MRTRLSDGWDGWSGLLFAPFWALSRGHLNAAGDSVSAPAMTGCVARGLPLPCVDKQPVFFKITLPTCRRAQIDEGQGDEDLMICDPQQAADRLPSLGITSHCTSDDAWQGQHLTDAMCAQCAFVMMPSSSGPCEVLVGFMLLGGAMCVQWWRDTWA